MIGLNCATKKMFKEDVKANKNTPEIADVDSEVCEGNVQLEITPFESFSQINKYKKYLATIKNIRVVSETWSEDEGFNILVSVRVPLVLGRVLLDMPEVARVKLNSKPGCNGQKNGYKKMVVVMKTLATTPELASD